MTVIDSSNRDPGESTSDEEELGSFVAAIKAAIDRNNKRKRQHANFFDWYDKESKHLGIAAEFCQQMERQYGIAYWIAPESELEPGSPIDPPDVVLKDVDGALVGLEITEIASTREPPLSCSTRLWPPKS